jgi:ferrochelatase
MSAMSEFPEGERSRIHLIFSAHAVPVRHIEQFGDDYVVHVRESAKLIGGALGGKFSASIAYQSKAPSGKWTGPALKEELHRLGKSGVDNCIIIPISFIHDSVETWCDIDMSILPNARKFGMRKICRARPPIDSDGVVDALVETITQVLSLKRGESG